MNFLENQIGEEPEINMTPLIDVIFIMLIFFMLTTSFAKSSGIQVELPEAESASAIDLGDTPTVITLKPDGRTLLEGKEYKDDDLAEQLRLRKAKQPRLEVVIQADKSTAHGQVVEVLDILQQQKILNLSVETL